MENAKHTAIELLKRLGFAADSIEESQDGKRADIRAVGEHSVYLIEVKEKHDVEPTQEQIDQFRLGQVVSDTQPTTHNNRISGLMRDARTQLDETPSDGEFKLIWFQAQGIDSGLIFSRILATFYGRVDLADTLSCKTWGCYYFDFAESITMPTVDGVFILCNDGLSLLVNEHSERFEEFTRSELHNLIDSMGGSYNPATVDGVIRFKTDSPTASDDAKLAKLNEQHNANFLVFRMKEHSASVPIRRRG